MVDGRSGGRTKRQKDKKEKVDSGGGSVKTAQTQSTLDPKQNPASPNVPTSQATGQKIARDQLMPTYSTLVCGHPDFDGGRPELEKIWE